MNMHPFGNNVNAFQNSKCLKRLKFKIYFLHAHFKFVQFRIRVKKV